MTTDSTTNDDLEQARFVSMISRLHTVREDGARVRRADAGLSQEMRDYLSTLPDRALWDGEREIGVALKERPGTRYLDFEGLTDAQIVDAARQGWLNLNASAFDGGLHSSDLRVQGFAQELNRVAVRAGVTEALVLTPRGGIDDRELR